MIEKLMKLVRGDSGNVLVVTLLILFAIAIIGSTVAMVSTMDLKISGNQRASTRAFFVAEAGLNEAIHRLTIADPTIVTVGGWTGNAAIGDSEPYDPNWTAMIYLTSPSTAPASGGSIVRTGTIQDPSGTYLEYSSQAGTDGVLTIQHKWRDRNGDGNRDQNEIVRYDPIMVPPENFTSGKPVEVVTVTGRSAGGMTVIQAEISKQRVLVRTLGALYVDKAISLKGNCAFCGYNHSHNTPPGTRPDTKKGGAPECYSWHTASGHLPGVTSTGDKIDVKGSVDVSGNPVPIDNSAANPFYSLAEVLGLPQSDVDKLLSGADNTTIV
ncbi:MAG: pilus assembly PilX N-terminal domain-containing protein, partial [Candidatus Krumholzibacteria bacterium]|nr:pilus assembly PilX N-terminal domain-containing protein [Candidatus Krumholzibacteria bacterium]